MKKSKYYTLTVKKRENDKLFLAYTRFHPVDCKKVKSKLIFERFTIFGEDDFYIWRLVYSDIPVAEDFKVNFKIKPLRFFNVLNELYAGKNIYTYHYYEYNK